MAGYIGTTPVPQATQKRDSFTATEGQTSFATSGYTQGFVDVFLNGVKLAPTDYTATNGSDVVLTVGAAANDILETISYTAFEIANVAYNFNFYKSDSTLDTIPVTAGAGLPFYKSNGSLDNLQLV